MLRACAATLAILLPTGAAHSGATLLVSAVVPRTVQLAVRAHPETLVVTQADVSRGYHDVGPGPRLRVKTNSREGVQIVFLASGDVVRAVRVGGSGEALSFPGTARGAATHEVELDYRLILRPDARAGVYPWPV